MIGVTGDLCICAGIINWYCNNRSGLVTTVSSAAQKASEADKRHGVELTVGRSVLIRQVEDLRFDQDTA